MTENATRIEHDPDEGCPGCPLHWLDEDDGYSCGALSVDLYTWEDEPEYRGQWANTHRDRGGYMDNRTFDVTSKGRDHFDAVMRIAFANTPGGKARRYRTGATGALVLSWRPDASKRDEALPYEMNLEQASDFVWYWLASTKRGSTPDIDGSWGRGFRVYCEAWGHVDDDEYAFVAIQPAWALYGK